MSKNNRMLRKQLHEGVFLARSNTCWLAALCLAETGTMFVFLNYSAVLPLLQSEWGLSSAEAGLINTAYQVGYILSVVIFATATDYIGSKPIYVVAALWAGLANLLFASYANDLVSALILRTLTGVGLAGTYMPGMKMVTERFGREQRGRAVGLYVAAFSLGSALSLLLAGTLTATLGWRSAFAVTSLGPMGAALLAFLVISSGRAVKRSAILEMPLPSLSQTVLTNRAAWIFIIAYAAHTWELYGNRTWMPTYLAMTLRRSGNALPDAVSVGASLSALMLVAGAIATVFAGLLSDRWGRVPTILLFMVASIVLTASLGWAATLPFSLLVILSIATSMLATGDSPALSTGLTEVVLPERLGAAQALQSLLGFGSMALAPLAFGWLLDMTNDAGRVIALGYWPEWGWAFTGLALVAMVGPLTILQLRRKDENGSAAFAKLSNGSPSHP